MNNLDFFKEVEIFKGLDKGQIAFSWIHAVK